MSCHGASNELHDGDSIALVGNPNVGKSVLFGLLTGRYAVVSNYPGTTVEVTRGTATVAGDKVGIVDTPGTNGLTPMSEDERVTRDVLLNEPVRAVVQVLDAKNLRRGLLLSTQIAEMGLPIVIALNMMDEAASRGIEVNSVALSQTLGVDVVKTVAVQRKGIGALNAAMAVARPSLHRVTLDRAIEVAAAEIGALLPDIPARRGLALMLLSGDASLGPWLAEHVAPEAAAGIEEIRRRAQAAYAEPLGYVIGQRRGRAVDAMVGQVLRAEPRSQSNRGLAVALGNWSMHPVWGIPILLVVLALFYAFVGKFVAGTVAGWSEGTLFGRWINPWLAGLVTRWVPVPLLRDFFVGRYGLVAMTLTYALGIILPIVGAFFFAFGILEDSGYLPRLAIMVDRVFRAIGLNGKAVLPMILGLGCDTMATLTTRILETRKERVLTTLLLALAVPCSAQLGVFLGMLGGVSPLAVLIWLGIVVLVMLVVGFLAARVLPGQRSEFLLELPPLRVPKLSNLLIKTLARMEWYLKEAVPLFAIGSVVLFAASATGALSELQRLASPIIVRFLGLPAGAADAFVVGILRRDYGAAGLFAMRQAGALNPRQVVVSLVAMTLFVPCISQLLVIIKERGWRTAAAILAFIVPTALLVGGALNWALIAFKVAL